MKLCYGFTLLELIAAAAMLAVLLTTSCKCSTCCRPINRPANVDARRCKLLRQLPSKSTIFRGSADDRSRKSSQNSATTRTILTWVKATLTVVEEPTPAASKRIMLELIWNGPDGQVVAPVHLTSWAFRD